MKGKYEELGEGERVLMNSPAAVVSSQQQAHNIRINSGVNIL